MEADDTHGTVFAKIAETQEIPSAYES